jgi:Cu2+-exporting ATPase
MSIDTKSCCASEAVMSDPHSSDKEHIHSTHSEHNSMSCHSQSEHDGHSGHGDHAAMFRNKFWISLLLTIPAVFYSHMLQDTLGYEAPMFPGSHWIAPIFGLATFVYGGPVFLKSGWQEIKNRKPGMMLLISMGLIVALLASIATQFGWIDVDLWFELATLVTIMLLGHWIEMRAVGQAQDALEALAALLPDEAEIVENNGTRSVAISELNMDDVVLVRSGGRIPADGIIIEGEAEIDESMLTGESKSVSKSVNAEVVAGTIVTDTSIRVKVTALGEDTALAGIMRLVKEAQSSRSRAQALADRFAALLFYVAVASAVVTFVVWTLLGDVVRAIENTVTVLIIACPHALGLAIPLTIAVSTGLAARSGILIKDRMALEKMRTIDAVLFDKTGTLTLGQHRVSSIAAVNMSEEDLLQTAAAIESDSEHPLARAIVEAAQKNGSVPKANGFTSSAGRGVQAKLDGSTYDIGGPALVRELELDVPEQLKSSVDGWKSRGSSILYVAKDKTIIGAISLEDEIRPESKAAIESLHKLKKKAIMMTGDAQQVADAVGNDLGVDEIFAEVLPEDKDKKVAELMDRGIRVAMVGDGVNDAPALARADVGIAIGAGTDVAIESAGVVLASSDPRAVVSTIILSKASYRKMKQNLAWGAGYNLAAIPLAGGLFYFAGIELSPAMGAFVMSASTVIVALNAQLLRRLSLK